MESKRIPTATATAPTSSSRSVVPLCAYLGMRGGPKGSTATGGRPCRASFRGASRQTPIMHAGGPRHAVGSALNASTAFGPTPPSCCRRRRPVGTCAHPPLPAHNTQRTELDASAPRLPFCGDTCAARAFFRRATSVDPPRLNGAAPPRPPPIARVYFALPATPGGDGPGPASRVGSARETPPPWIRGGGAAVGGGDVVSRWQTCAHFWEWRTSTVAGPRPAQSCASSFATATASDRLWWRTTSLAPRAWWLPDRPRSPVFPRLSRRRPCRPRAASRP